MIAAGHRLSTNSSLEGPQLNDGDVVTHMDDLQVLAHLPPGPRLLNMPSTGPLDVDGVEQSEWNRTSVWEVGDGTR